MPLIRPPATLLPARQLAEQAFSRAANAPLSSGNAIELLIDARAHFDAWLAAIAAARHHVLLDSYMVRDDAIGHAFLDALTAAAARGVTVCVIRDWLGCFRLSRDAFWQPLRDAGGTVRVFNPPDFTRPFGWMARDHRKMLVVDGSFGSLTGVCISERWLGDAANDVAPWRDTGVILRGPAVADLEQAFADAWGELGTPLELTLPPAERVPGPAGDVDLRIIATRPQTAGVYRLDQLIASMARQSLWLTDAYFVGVATYVQALAAAARDGVDVRLLVPGSSDVPVVAALSRGGYRPLLEAGVRVFEWQGSMLHAKTAVADGRWARVGSSNLNLASWLGNYELDVAVEDLDFARAMQEQYQRDLANATEVVLSQRARRRVGKRAAKRYRGGSSGRAAAGAMRLAHSVGSALGNQRVLGSNESGLLFGAAVTFAVIALLAMRWPWLIAWPLAFVLLWFAASMFLRVARQRARKRRETEPPASATRDAP